jgi:hypothetical protein
MPMYLHYFSSVSFQICGNLWMEVFSEKMYILVVDKQNNFTVF